MKKGLSLLAPHKRKILIFASIIMVAAALLLLLEKNNVINLVSRDPLKEDDAKTTSTAATAQEDFSGGNDREAGNSISENEGSAELSDNNGAIAPDTNTSNSVVSNSGQITLYTPQRGATITTGIMVTGKSSLPVVSYRLIDSISGVIASGDIRVVNGNFSGTLTYNTGAPEGRLDIFAAQADGTEYSNIEIPLRFR